jgi:cytoskeletal protein CcmA (bactofilin family)
MKRLKFLIFGAGLATSLLLPLAMAKAEASSGDSIKIAANEIVDGNLYAIGRTIEVDGTISGDLVALADHIVVNGRIEGDVIAAANQININGSVGGNIRLAGETLTINAPVARNATVFADHILLAEKSSIGWDVYAVASTFKNQGKISGRLSGHAGQAELLGSIERENGLQIEKAESQKSGFVSWLWPFVLSLLSFFASGLILVLLFKNLSEKIIKSIDKNPLHSSLSGLLALIIAPLACLILAITIIGLPLALIGLAALLTASYFGQIFVSLLFGSVILKALSNGKIKGLLWPLALGSLIFCLLFSLPYAGPALRTIAAILGLGGLISYASDQSRRL